MRFFWLFLGIVFIIYASVKLLQLFDRIAGRGPSQISDGMKKYDREK